MDSTALTAPPAKVSQAEFARQLGVTRQTINEHVQKGTLLLDEDGRLDLEASRAALAAVLDPGSKIAQAIAPAAPSAAPPTAGAVAEQATMGFNTAKTLREITELRIADLKLKEMQGELVRVDVVRAAMAAKVAAMREALLQIPSRLTPVLAAESDPQKIFASLDAELRNALEFVSQPTTEERTTT